MATKRELLKIIRGKCLDCCCGQDGAVRACTTPLCSLFPYRMGTDPERHHVSDAQKARLVRNFAKAGEKRMTAILPSSIIPDHWGAEDFALADHYGLKNVQGEKIPAAPSWKISSSAEFGTLYHASLPARKNHQDLHERTGA